MLPFSCLNLIKGETANQYNFMAIYMAALASEEHKGRSLPSAVGCPPAQPGTQRPQRRTLPGYGPVTLMKRPVRSRMQDVVGAGRKTPGYPIRLFYAHIIDG